MSDRIEKKPKMRCPYCDKVKPWTEFHFGTWRETTPIVCNVCLEKGKVERAFLDRI